MTFKDEAKEAIADIINSEFGESIFHTPQGGVAQPVINCLIGDSIMHGDDEKSFVISEETSITCISSEVIAVKYRDTITLTSDSTEFQVVNNPYSDSRFSGASVIDLRRDRQNETRI